MPDTLRVSNIRFVPAPLQERSRGLRGWASFDIDEQLELTGVAVRRTLEGRLCLSFPEHRDRRGTGHPYVRPLGPRTREHIESQVFSVLRKQGYFQ